MNDKKDGKDGAGFWHNGKFFWEGQEHEVYEYDRKKRERRERVNGPEHTPSSICDCGAKHDREFPNIHSPFCRAYMGNR